MSNQRDKSLNDMIASLRVRYGLNPNMPSRMLEYGRDKAQIEMVKERERLKQEEREKLKDLSIEELTQRFADTHRDSQQQRIGRDILNDFYQ